MKLRFPWRSPFNNPNRLRSKLNYGYLIAMSISVGGSLLGMVIADYFQGQGIIRLHQAHIQASLLRQFRDVSQQAQLQGAEIKLLLDSPEQIRAQTTRLHNNHELIRKLGTELTTFSEQYPKYLAVSRSELKLIIQNHLTAFDAQHAAILTILPPGSTTVFSSDEQARLNLELQQVERNLYQSEIRTVDWQLERALADAERQATQAEIDLETAQGFEKGLIVVSLFLSIVLGGSFVWQFSKRLLAPIEELTRTTEAIAESQDYSLRTPVVTTDEAGQLAQDFNQLISAIEQQTTELIHAKENAEAASQAKSTFLATMTHELRTPLNAVLGYTELLLSSQSYDSQTQESLETIQKSGHHLLNLVNDVLHLSRIEAGKAQVEGQDFDFYALLHNLEGMFTLTARQKGLKLQWDVANNIPQYLHSDATKLRQIIINLVGNALKFTKVGQVIVKIMQVEVEQLTTPQLQIQVQDTGIGIAPDELTTLFDPFTQTQSGRDFQQGTGLGLALSEKFARLLGGNITVESIEQVGSTFTLQIPCSALTTELSSTKTQSHYADIKLTSNLSITDITDEEDDQLTAATQADYQQIMGTSWCEQLHQASLEADAQVIEQLIKKIPTQHNQLIAILQKWLQDYRFDLLAELFTIPESIGIC
ncbi:MAG: HAMP domain-containing protein [Spirulina sp. SIO3F2]|nr:HAMP domain-containing protein [Spirulina sp. SIO3F2]